MNCAFLFSPDDPMNFLHPNDRLASVLRKKVKPMTIPVLDVQKQLNEDFQDKIENLNLQILDLADALQISRDREARLRQSINGLQANMAGHTTLMNDRNAAVARCTSMETQVKKLEADLKTEVGNRDHFRALVAQQDAFIKEAKRQIEEFKRKKEEELKAKTSEAEHLAKQVLKLKAENDKYLGSEYTDFKKVNDQLNAQTANLLEDIRKFKEQTTRLVEEKRVLSDEILAERKFSLALDDKLQKRDEELAHERNVGIKRWQTIETLVDAIKKLKLMPCITWRQQGKLIRETQAKVDAYQAEVEQMRKSFHKV